LIGILYLTVWANPAAFGALGTGHLIFNWTFALAMPFLIGLVFAVQLHNLCENKTCPATGTASGAVGGLLGIASVACPICPAVFLGWLGLAGAVSSAILSSIWFKTLSLLLLIVALLAATKGRN
jgi:hypothetical protein